jgi:hypothetical protein
VRLWSSRTRRLAASASRFERVAEIAISSRAVSAFSSHGRELVHGDETGRLWFLDAGTGRRLGRALASGGHAVTDFAFLGAAIWWPVFSATGPRRRAPLSDTASCEQAT